MRWNTEVSHRTKTPPQVTVITFPNPEAVPEVNIDVHGGGLYLSVAEARQLADDLLAAVANAEQRVRQG